MATSQQMRPSASSAHASRDRVLDLGGQAIHVFQFDTPISRAYEYFLNIPSVFRLLPDTLDVQPYSDKDYRLVVGANDGYGHAMSAIFDLHADCEHERSIRIKPATNGPAVRLSGLVFKGDLWAEAHFKPGRAGTAVEYSVELALSIPIPGVLRMVPQNFLQNLGEHAMSFKMTHMISGFARDIETDFHRWCKEG